MSDVWSGGEIACAVEFFSKFLVCTDMFSLHVSINPSRHCVRESKKYYFGNPWAHRGRLPEIAGVSLYDMSSLPRIFPKLLSMSYPTQHVGWVLRWGRHTQNSTKYAVCQYFVTLLVPLALLGSWVVRGGTVTGCCCWRSCTAAAREGARSMSIEKYLETSNHASVVVGRRFGGWGYGCR